MNAWGVVDALGLGLQEYFFFLFVHVTRLRSGFAAFCAFDSLLDILHRQYGFFAG